MARKTVSLKGQALKDFRHQVKVLKAKGLTSKSVDARKQKPTRYMRDKVKRFADVIHEQATSVKVKPAVAREYRDAGFRVFGNRVVVDADRETVARVRKGHVITRRRLGPSLTEERIYLPVSVKSFDQLLFAVDNNPDKFNGPKDPSDVFAFKFFGSNSLAMFEDIELLVEYIHKYEALQDPQYRDEAWENLVIYRVLPSAWKRSPKGKSRRQRSSREPERPLKAKWQKNAERARYWRDRRMNDLEWAAKQREKDRARWQERKNNPEYVAKKRAADLERVHSFRKPRSDRGRKYGYDTD